MTAMRVIRTKMASTVACVIAKGGSVCVGANALRAATFTKLCLYKSPSQMKYLAFLRQIIVSMRQYTVNC